MRLEVKYVTGGDRAAEWGSEPNYRAQIKKELAGRLATMLRTRDVIAWSWRLDENGDFEVTGVIEVQPAAAAE